MNAICSRIRYIFGKAEKTRLLAAGRSSFAASILGRLWTLFVFTEATQSTLFSMFYCMPVARVVNYVLQLHGKKAFHPLMQARLLIGSA